MVDAMALNLTQLDDRLCINGAHFIAGRSSSHSSKFRGSIVACHNQTVGIWHKLEIISMGLGLGLPFRKGEEPEYDPHQHRVIHKATNNFETLVHLLKCALGTGILAIPQAFSRSGLVIGVVGTIVVGIILTHCLHLLITMQYKVCKIKRVPQMTYPKVLEAAMKMGPRCLRGLSKPTACTVDFFNITYELGVCCVYIVFIASNVQKIFDPRIPLIIYMSICSVLLIILNLIPNLKALAPLSLVANVVTMIGLTIIVYYFFTAKKAFPSDKINLWGNGLGIPGMVGTVLFALTAVPVVVALEREMKTPRDYTTRFGVLNIGMGFIIILYASFGLFGYLYCLSSCSDSITLDMPYGWGSRAVQFLMVVAITISYALHAYVPVDIIYKNYMLPRMNANNASKKKRMVWEYVLRAGLALFTVFVAISVPRLGLFISLLGAFCLCSLGICYPSLMEICLSYPDQYGPGKIKLFKDIFLFVFGLFGLVTGTYFAVRDIIRSFL